MKSFTFIFLFCLSLIPILANSDSAEKAEALCACMKNAKKSNKAEDKKSCLELREKHTKELGKNSPAYTWYINLLGECEKEIK